MARITAAALRGFAVCVIVAVSASAAGLAQDWEPGRAVGDVWLGEAPTPEWEGEKAAAAYALRSKRHKAYMQGDVPAEYRNARSPYPAAGRLIEDGRALYTAHCSGCHGEDGFGDGEAAMDLRPTPAVLAFMIDSPDLIDPYLMWTVAEGGAAFESEMPAYKDVLSDRDIWKVIIFMRAGFSADQQPAGDN